MINSCLRERRIYCSCSLIIRSSRSIIRTQHCHYYVTLLLFPIPDITSYAVSSVISPSWDKAEICFNDGINPTVTAPYSVLDESSCFWKKISKQKFEMAFIRMQALCNICFWTFTLPLVHGYCIITSDHIPSYHREEDTRPPPPRPHSVT